jgi:hypothetical protein
MGVSVEGGVGVWVGVGVGVSVEGTGVAVGGTCVGVSVGGAGVGVGVGRSAMGVGAGGTGVGVGAGTPHPTNSEMTNVRPTILGNGMGSPRIPASVVFGHEVYKRIIGKANAFVLPQRCLCSSRL